MRRLTYTILTVLASLALVSPLYAEGEFSEQARGTTFRQNTMLDNNNTNELSMETRIGLAPFESARQLLGQTVITRGGEDIGEIDDLKVNPLTGRIDYVVVEKEGAMGVGELAFVPVPVGALVLTGDDARLVVDKSKLENVPSPGALSDRAYREGLNAHYGIAPAWEEERTIIRQEESEAVKPSAKQLLGQNVITPDGEDIGEIGDLKVDPQTGRIDYVVVEKEDAMGVGESVFVPVPLGALSFTGDDTRLVVDKSKLENVPSPEAFSAREYREGLNAHYGIAPIWEEERTIIRQEERKTVKP